MVTQLFRRIARTEAEEHFRQGLHYRNRRAKEFSLELAIKHFKEAIKLDPAICRYHIERGKACVPAPLLAVMQGISNSLRLEKCLELAIQALEQAPQCAPGQIEPYLLLAEAYLYMGVKNKAEVAFRLAINIPSMSFIESLLLKSYAKRRLKQLGHTVNKQAQLGAALKYLEQALSHGNDGDYHLSAKKLMQAFKPAPYWSWLYKTICKLNG